MTLAIMGLGGPFFIKAAYGPDQAKLFLLVFSVMAPAIVLLLIGTSYSSLHWLAVVAVALGAGGLIWIRRLVNNDR
ncbi:MAG: hypothetical protein HOW97_04685 [Catenulispora sp.]|nr:hypothetical protein [Catenulispora sp.]